MTGTTDTDQNDGSLPGGSWKDVTGAALAEGRLEVNRDGIVECIRLCDEHASAMRELAERAKRELRVDALGIGEGHLESARLLLQKFQDKAIGGGQIAHSSSAVGLFRTHESHAKDMRSTFEAVLKAYDEQEGINVDSLNGVAGSLG